MTDPHAAPDDTALATLGGGCFWCLEAVYARADGVISAVSGYMGGQVPQPTYAQVCSGRSGHAEVVQVRFDPARIAYADLLDIFFAIHDPTTRDRQGNDVGPQYRSAIFFHDERQRDEAQSVIAALQASGRFGAPLVTEVSAASTFWPAEDYHQGYFDSHGHEPYCQYVVAPKVAKFMKTFPQRLRPR